MKDFWRCSCTSLLSALLYSLSAGILHVHGVAKYDEKYDYCHGLDNVLLNIPKRVPRHSLITKDIGLNEYIRGWKLMAEYLNMTVQVSEDYLDGMDIVWEPLAETRQWHHDQIVLYGPEFSIFPARPYGGKEVERDIHGHRYYTTGSDWYAKVHAQLGGWKWPTVAFPFAVNTVDKRKPERGVHTESKKDNIVLISKGIGKEIVTAVQSFLDGIEGLNVTHYQLDHKYDADIFHNILQYSGMAVYVGKYEIQGFEYQKCLSMDIPLLVLDCGDMRGTGGCPGGPFCNFDSDINLDATSVPYWNRLAGERVFSIDEMTKRWNVFSEKARAGFYQPSTVVEEFVSPRSCALRLMKLYSRHRNIWCAQHRLEDDDSEEVLEPLYETALDVNRLPLAYPSQQFIDDFDSIESKLGKDNFNTLDNKKQESISLANEKKAMKVKVRVKYDQGTDYCTNMDDVPNIPPKMPRSSVIVKRSHTKNHFGWLLMANYLNMSVNVRKDALDLAYINHDEVDIVWDPFDDTQWWDMLTIFGPEWPTLPTPPLGGFNTRRYKKGHSYFTALSDWNVKVHAKMGGWKYPTIAFPFPVDTDYWVPTIPRKNRTGVLLMSKRRNKDLVNSAARFLVSKGYNVTHFDYQRGYSEDEFISSLHKAKLGVWIGQHESQGFGFQECLQMDVPLMVIDCGDMRAQGGGCPVGPFCHYGPEQDLTATSASSWSTLGGEIVESLAEMVVKWDDFVAKVEKGEYDPAAIVEKYVSPKACAERLLKLYSRHRNIWCYQKHVDERGHDSFFNITMNPNELPIAYPSQQFVNDFETDESIARRRAKNKRDRDNEKIFKIRMKQEAEARLRLGDGEK